MPRRQEHLVEPCPQCGNDTGIVFLSRWSRPDSKTYQGRPDEEKVKKRYPLESRLIPKESELSGAIGEVAVLSSAIRCFLPKLLDRYPELKTNLEYYTRGMKVWAKMLGMLTDNRTSFHPMDWFNIIILKKMGGYHRASRAYGVSVNQIKNREAEIEQLAKEVGEYGLGSRDLFREVINILDRDSDMKAEFGRHIVAVKEADERIKRLKSTKDLDANYEYEYYYIKHFDHDNGTTRCGPFKESALPISLLENYWRGETTNIDYGSESSFAVSRIPDLYNV